jgi:hypothetical protein
MLPPWPSALGIAPRRNPCCQRHRKARGFHCRQATSIAPAPAGCVKLVSFLRQARLAQAVEKGRNIRRNRLQRFDGEFGIEAAGLRQGGLRIVHLARMRVGVAASSSSIMRVADDIDGEDRGEAAAAVIVRAPQPCGGLPGGVRVASEKSDYCFPPRHGSRERRSSD